MLGSHVTSQKTKMYLRDSLGLSLVFLTVYAPVNAQRSMDLVSPHCLYSLVHVCECVRMRMCDCDAKLRYVCF